jgi:glycosyltransferase involved in cell wall biosynthesis
VYKPDNIAAAWSATRRGIPYIVMPHGGYNKRARRRRRYKKGVWLPVERAYLERSLAVHVFFDIETRDASEMTPKARWLVAPTGIELPADRWDGGTGGYLAWIGRYDIRTKGLDLLLHAMTHLPPTDRHPLRMHGRSSYDSGVEVQRIAHASNVAAAVTIGGELAGSEKADFLRRAVAYVHPSRWESHSLAIVEALAYGIPSVVSEFCAIAPQLQATNAAVIVDPTPACIAQGISTVLRDPQQYSARAVRFVETNLAWDVIIKNYFEQLESLLAGNRCSLG